MTRIRQSPLFASAIGALVLGFLLSSTKASAFCRSTTCRSTATRDCVQDQDGCTAEGAKLFWPTSCISYATNRLGTADLDAEETRAAIRKTFQAWSDVKCADGSIAAMTFQERDPVPCKRSEYRKGQPNVNVVLFQDDDWKYRGIDATIAKTSVTFNETTGEIYDADIEINTANNTVTISDVRGEIDYDLQAVLTHEVGHFIGIAHSPEPTAVMYATYTPGSITQRTLHPDDIDAVCSVYPASSPRVCDPEPRNGFSGTCPDPEEGASHCSARPSAAPASSVALAGFAASGFILAARLRRRKRALGIEGESR
jgi:hypothetical protein